MYATSVIFVDRFSISFKPKTSKFYLVTIHSYNSEFNDIFSSSVTGKNLVG